MNFKNRIVGSGTADPKTLKANPLNWRKHPDAQRKAMNDVLSSVGWIQDVIINKTTGNLIDGHLRVETAVKNKETEIPVKYVELTADEEKAALAFYDPISAMAEQDDELLKQLLADVDTDIDLSQFLDDYDKLMRPEHTAEELDAVPDVPAEPRTQRGDLYKLGDHYLLCGDSTNEADVARLIGGLDIDTAILDPPYDVPELYSAIKYVSSSTWIVLFSDFTHFSDPILHARENNLKPRWQLVWDCAQCWYLPNSPLECHKTCFVYGNGVWDFDNGIVPDTKKREAKVVHNPRGYCDYTPVEGGHHLKTVEMFPFTQQGQKEYHRHVKPTDWLIGILSGLGASCVVDLFGGSGSVIIACEQIGCKCRTMELAPEYCDVIVDRWEKLTGKKAELIRNDKEDFN